jgi:hypothetical protein
MRVDVNPDEKGAEEYRNLVVACYNKMNTTKRGAQQPDVSLAEVKLRLFLSLLDRQEPQRLASISHQAESQDTRGCSI